MTDQKSEHDEVRNPAHYDLFPGQQAIDVIRAALTPEEFAGYCKGNALKYRLRAGEKGDAGQDLAKSNWYRDKLRAQNPPDQPKAMKRAEGFNNGHGAPICATHWDVNNRNWIAQDTDGGYSEFRQHGWFPIPVERATDTYWLFGLQAIVK